MVDFHSQSKIHRYGYAPAPVRHRLTLDRQIRDVKALILFQRHGKKRPHDCRLEVLKEASDRKDWETQLLCHGLRKTCADIDTLYSHSAHTDKTNRRNKLLFQLGRRGDSEGDFCHPRGVAVTDESDLVIADTANHRVQVLNQCGVFKFAVGQKGSDDGQFDHPTGVSVLTSGEIVVADNKNKRVQIFHPDGEFKLAFPTPGEAPFSVTCDRANRIIVGTTSKAIEIYTKGGTLKNKFRVRSRKRSKGMVPVLVASNERNEIIVLDPEEQSVKYFSDKGQLLGQFSLEQTPGGLTIAPSSVCLGPSDHVLIGDSLNHAVCMYSNQGVLIEQILGPTDGLGPVQSCGLSPEGHLAVTEFSVTGEHCVKIFRFDDCICHKVRPGSSKRRELTKSPEKEIPVTYRSGTLSSKSEVSSSTAQPETAVD